MLETMIINFADSQTELNSFIDLRFISALKYIADQIMNPVYDMKEIQGNINTLEFLDKYTLQQKLRKEYYTIQIILLTVMLMIAIVVALVVNPTFIKMICVIAWFAPIVDYVISNFVTLSKDIRRLDELCKKCDKLEWDINNKELTDITSELILIQYAIRENREKAFMVPDWFYEVGN